MKRFLIVTSSLLLFVSACTPQPKSIFDYDASIPFDVKVSSQTEREGVMITDLSYAVHDPSFSSPTNGRTIAYLVTPQGEGPFAGVIYLHWLGVGNSNRNQFLDEAVELAKHGVISLLPQGCFPWMATPNLTESDRQEIIGQTIELRRAIDFLLTQPGIDSKQLGFVGHDYGALFGGVLSGVDQRLKTSVLIAGTPTFADFITVGTTLPDGYVPLIEDLDPIHYVSKANPASLFFQFAERDVFIAQDKANRFYEAASEPKKIAWYDDNHQMAIESARQDRIAWLVEQFGLK